jgi:hypothetical protein
VVVDVSLRDLVRCIHGTVHRVRLLARVSEMTFRGLEIWDLWIMAWVGVRKSCKVGEIDAHYDSSGGCVRDDIPGSRNLGSWDY